MTRRKRNSFPQRMYTQCTLSSGGGNKSMTRHGNSTCIACWLFEARNLEAMLVDGSPAASATVYRSGNYLSRDFESPLRARHLSERRQYYSAEGRLYLKFSSTRRRRHLSREATLIRTVLLILTRKSAKHLGYRCCSEREQTIVQNQNYLRRTRSALKNFIRLEPHRHDVIPLRSMLQGF